MSVFRQKVAIQASSGRTAQRKIDRESSLKRYCCYVGWRSSPSAIELPRKSSVGPFYRIPETRGTNCDCLQLVPSQGKVNRGSLASHYTRGTIVDRALIELWLQWECFIKRSCCIRKLVKLVSFVCLGRLARARLNSFQIFYKISYNFRALLRNFAQGVAPLLLATLQIFYAFARKRECETLRRMRVIRKDIQNVHKVQRFL